MRKETKIFEQVKPVLMFSFVWTVFLNADPQMQFFNLLSDSNILVTIMQSLSEVVCLSLRLDTSGVVQRDLSSIIDALLSLFDVIALVKV